MLKPTLSRRAVLTLAMSATAALALPAARAQSAAPVAAYPNRPVRIIVPFPSGGATDILARTLAHKLVALWGQSVIVENRPGAGGTLGSAELMKASPDGHTLVLGTTSTHSIAPSLYKNLGYTAEKDFTPISQIAAAPNVLLVTPQLKAADVRQLIALAKAQSGRLNYASSGNGTIVHLQTELFAQLSDTRLTHIPYKGTALAMPDLISGQVQLMFDSIVSALPHIKAGRVRALAVTSSQRSPLLPEVPTVIESGLAGYEVNTYFALFAPAKTPAALIDRLQVDVAKALQGSDVRERFVSQGAEVVGGTPAALAELVKNESAKWKRVIQTADVSLD